MASAKTLLKSAFLNARESHEQLLCRVNAAGASSWSRIRWISILGSFESTANCYRSLLSRPPGDEDRLAPPAGHRDDVERDRGGARTGVRTQGTDGAWSKTRTCSAPQRNRWASAAGTAVIRTCHIRLMVALLYLKYAYNESDESVVERWAQDMYLIGLAKYFFVHADQANTPSE